MDTTYYIGGVNVGVLDDTHLVIEPFSLWLFGINEVYTLTTTITPNLRLIGLNGMDVNPNGSGNMPPDWAYNIFAIYDNPTGDFGFIITKATAVSDIVLPTGWSLANLSYRKISYGITVTGGVLMTNHTTHWPMPRVDFTNQILLASFTTTQTDTTVDVAKYVPDSSRFVNFRAVLTGTGNNLWLSPTAGTAFRKLFCYNGQDVKPGLWSRVQYTYGTPSTSMVYVTFQPGASGRLDLYVDGFAMTEVD